MNPTHKQPLAVPFRCLSVVDNELGLEYKCNRTV